MYTLDAAAAPGTTWSYGCNLPQTIGTTTYPNTSCVDLVTGAAQDFATCSAGLCNGQAISRIYWQKETSTWQAGSEAGTGNLSAAFVNWGDNLETGQWTDRSIVRTETTPFFDYSTDHVPVPPATVATLRGYQMWHVYGQGTNELWGVRTTDPAPDSGESVAPYAYDSKYSIIYTTNARLNLTKLAELQGPGCGDPPVYPTLTTPPDWSGSHWGSGYCSVMDIPYTPELNIGGKFVYGYNWNVRRLVLGKCLNSDASLSSKAGWWRMTFYSSDVSFLTDIPKTEPTDTPVYYTYSPTSAITRIAEEGGKYTATVDVDHNLTYIDICINPSLASGR